MTYILPLSLEKSAPQLKLPYHTLLESLLECGIVVWDSTADCHIKTIQVLQNQIVKAIYKKKYYFPTIDLYKETKLMNVQQLYLKNLLIFQFKKKHLLKQICHLHDTRHRSIKILEIARQKKSLDIYVNFYHLF